MAHISFEVTEWIANNPKGKLEDLVKALKGADEVYCGWTVEDAESVRENYDSEKLNLSIDDSYQVMVDSTSCWDASVGYNWDDLYRAYDRHVEQLKNQSK
jgi:hypothetical protein